MSDDQEMHGDPEAAGGLSGSAARQRARRIAKLDALRARGIDPYPVTYPRDRDVASVREEHAELAAGAVTGDEVHLAGRLMLIRNHGGLLFAQLKDESGTIQLFISREAMGEQGFADARELDLGDWVGVAGTVMVTRHRRAVGGHDRPDAARPRRCARCPTRATASPTPTRASASATST